METDEIRAIIRKERQPIKSLLARMFGVIKKPEDLREMSQEMREVLKIASTELEVEKGTLEIIDHRSPIHGKFLVTKGKPQILINEGGNPALLYHELEHLHDWIEERDRLLATGKSPREAADQAFVLTGSSHGVKRGEVRATLRQIEEKKELNPVDAIGFALYPDLQELNTLMKLRTQLSTFRLGALGRQAERREFAQNVHQKIVTNIQKVGEKFDNAKRELIARLESAYLETSDLELKKTFEIEAEKLRKIDFDYLVEHLGFQRQYTTEIIDGYDDIHRIAKREFSKTLESAQTLRASSNLQLATVQSPSAKLSFGDPEISQRIRSQSLAISKMRGDDNFEHWHAARNAFEAAHPAYDNSTPALYFHYEIPGFDLSFKEGPRGADYNNRRVLEKVFLKYDPKAFPPGSLVRRVFGAKPLNLTEADVNSFGDGMHLSEDGSFFSIHFKHRDEYGALTDHAPFVMVSRDTGQLMFYTGSKDPFGSMTSIKEIFKGIQEEALNKWGQARKNFGAWFRAEEVVNMSPLFPRPKDPALKAP
jgi:hypothetical protein